MIRKFGVFVMTLGLVLSVSNSVWAGADGTCASESACCSGEKLGGGDMANKAATTCSDEQKAECAAAGKTCGESCSSADKLGGGDTAKKMAAATDTKAQYSLGDKVADFTVVDAKTGEEQSLSKLAGENGTLIVFWNQECPWVTGPRGAEKRIQALAAKVKEQGVSTILIDAGVNNTPESIKAHAETLTAPLLMNRDSSVAAKFNAQYTPHTFVLDKNMNLVYEGAFDVKRDGTYADYAAQAIADVVAGRTPAVQSAKGTGCSIKWAKGARPQS
ncbi:MAG: hypothetical protein PWP23_1654 [Candidatus Sumerlaeota bacterium]|nr:hypothetical protein [Candidatus Sumerlaeota bacterium]